MLKICSAAAIAVLVMGLGAERGAIAADADNGNQIYHTYCSVCHGPRMLNSGARASDLRKMKASQKAKFKKVVNEGRRGPKGEMPAWADILTPEEVNDLWAYVKTKGK